MKTKRIKNKFVSISFSMLLLLGIFATLLPQTVYATTIFSDGFESGNFSAWTETSGTPTIVTSPVYTRIFSIDVGQAFFANSGHWSDIQAAVDKASSAGGGNVYIPSGTYDFCNATEGWHTVNIPDGVNLFGAPTERYANGQVIEWRTVLVMPYEAPDGSTFFNFIINETKSSSFRFSDIKLVGYRYFNTSSTTMYYGVSTETIYTQYPTAGVANFRIDHCNFQDMCGSAIWIVGIEAEHNRREVYGVIDHNRLVNTIGVPDPYESRTLDYGIGMRRWSCDIWESNASNVFGRYNNYTVVIENNYFSKWRHGTCSNDGIHQIVRFNVFEGCYGVGEVDAHGSHADDNHPYAVGTRAIEVYNNTFKNPDKTWTNDTWALKAFAVNIRGGSSLVYNNTLIGYYALCDLNNDWGNYEPYRPDNFISQTYLWSNNLGEAVIIRYNSDNTENVNYFLRAPNLEQDGFEYTPYPYPHPLTIETSGTTPTPTPPPTPPPTPTPTPTPAGAIPTWLIIAIIVVVMSIGYIALKRFKP